MVKYLEMKNLNLEKGADKFDQNLIGAKLLKLRTLTFFQGENCYFINYCDAIKGNPEIFMSSEIEKLSKPFPVEGTEELGLLDIFVQIEDLYFCMAMLYSKRKEFDVLKDLKPERLKKIAKELHDTIDPEYPFRDIIEPTVMTITTIDGKLILK